MVLMVAGQICSHQPYTSRTRLGQGKKSKPEGLRNGGFVLDEAQAEIGYFMKPILLRASFKLRPLTIARLNLNFWIAIGSSPTSPTQQTIPSTNANQKPSRHQIPQAMSPAILSSFSRRISAWCFWKINMGRSLTAVAPLPPILIP